MATIEQFWLFHCGYFKTRRGLWLEDGGFEKVRLPMMAALLVHSELGPILIDAPFGLEGPSNAGEIIGALARRVGVVSSASGPVVGPQYPSSLDESG